MAYPKSARPRTRTVWYVYSYVYWSNGPCAHFLGEQQEWKSKDSHLWSITCLWLQSQVKHIPKYLWLHTNHSSTKAFKRLTHETHSWSRLSGATASNYYSSSGEKIGKANPGRFLARILCPVAYLEITSHSQVTSDEYNYIGVCTRRKPTGFSPGSALPCPAQHQSDKTTKFSTPKHLCCQHLDQAFQQAVLEVPVPYTLRWTVQNITTTGVLEARRRGKVAEWALRFRVGAIGDELWTMKGKVWQSLQHKLQVQRYLHTRC